MMMMIVSGGCEWSGVGVGESSWWRGWLSEWWRSSSDVVGWVAW